MRSPETVRRSHYHYNGAAAVRLVEARAQPGRFVSRPFVWAALAAALVPGFGVGTILASATLFGRPLGAWWPAAVQAHGHAQLFGFAGLMVFGLAFHFLPRLRGASLAEPRLVLWVLALYGGGILLRVAAQMLGPFVPAGSVGIGPALRLGFAASGPLTVLGAALGVALLVRTGTQGPPLDRRPGVVQILPLMVASWSSLLLALAINAYSTALAPAAPADDEAAAWLVAPPLDAAVVRLALLGWLVPIAVAFSARNFPLFVWTRLPSPRALRWGLAILLAGLLLDAPARLQPAAWAGSAEIGRALEGAALLWFTVTIGALGPKVRPPGRMSDAAEAQLARASAWPLVGAYAWLVVAGVLMLAPLVLLQGSLLVTPAFPAAWWVPPEDAERHALGAGFLLLLIVGMGLRLLPGFAGPHWRRVGLAPARLAIWAAHLAALLRVGPPLVVWLIAAASPAPAASGEAARGTTLALAGAGVLGMAAVVCFAAALRVPLALARPAADRS